MKKKIFLLIIIFIFCLSFAFSFFDKVSFAAEEKSSTEEPVTYVCETSSGKHFWFEGLPGFKPFIVSAEFPSKPESDRFRYYTYFIVANDYSLIKHFSGDLQPTNDTFNGVRCQMFQILGKGQFSVSPSVPFIQKDFNTYGELEVYISTLIKNPSLLPINVTTYDHSLGSLQLQDSTSWRFLRYEPFWTGNTVLKKAGYSYKVKLRTIFQDTTTTGQKYDKIQIMVRIKNIRSRWASITTHPWKDKLQDGEYFSYYLTDLKSPTTVDLQIFDYNDTQLLYPVFEPAFDKLGIKKPSISDPYWFFCDYTVCYRPITTDGKFGDWWYLTPENTFFGNNMLGGGKSISATTGTAASDEDPNSLSFNPLPEDSTSTRTATGNGETLGDAINDSNNSLIGGSISSGGSLTSNITDLFSLFTNMPSIISTIFCWLPPWVLSLFAIGFALFVPIFIYKFVRG